MNADRSSIRPASFAATATTLLALMAMTSMTSTASTLVNARGADLQSRTTLSESHMVRAMAAVMAAAARDLLVGDQHLTPIVTVPVESLPAVQTPTPSFGRSCDADAIVRSVALSERLLDLPPPVC